MGCVAPEGLPREAPELQDVVEEGSSSDGRWFPTRQRPLACQGWGHMRLVGEELGLLTCCLGLAGTEPHRRVSEAPPMESLWGQQGEGQMPSDAAALRAVMLKERTKPHRALGQSAKTECPPALLVPSPA